jgi:hypothetical protein
MDKNIDMSPPEVASKMMKAMGEFSEQMHKDALARAGEIIVDIHVVSRKH